MATTTNYGWTTPDDTSLVKDGAAAIRTLGSSVDTTTKALNPSTTLGDIEYRSSTANTNTRLGIGTTGQLLTVSGGVPVWATPAGGSKVVQIIHASTNTTVTSSTSTFVNTNLTATITPTSASNKVLVFVSQSGVNCSGPDRGAGLQLVRDSTVLQTGNYVVELGSGTGVAVATSWSANYLDSPATTSATTYKTQIASSTNQSFVNAQRNQSYSNITLMEVTP